MPIRDEFDDENNSEEVAWASESPALFRTSSVSPWHDGAAIREYWLGSEVSIDVATLY